MQKQAIYKELNIRSARTGSMNLSWSSLRSSCCHKAKKGEMAQLVPSGPHPDRIMAGADRRRSHATGRGKHRRGEPAGCRRSHDVQAGEEYRRGGPDCTRRRVGLCPRSAAFNESWSRSWIPPCRRSQTKSWRRFSLCLTERSHQRIGRKENPNARRGVLQTLCTPRTWRQTLPSTSCRTAVRGPTTVGGRQCASFTQLWSSLCSQYERVVTHWTRPRVKQHHHQGQQQQQQSNLGTLRFLSRRCACAARSLHTTPRS